MGLFVGILIMAIGVALVIAGVTGSAPAAYQTVTGHSAPLAFGGK